MPAGSLPSTDVSFATAFSFNNFTAPTGGLSFGGRTVSGIVHFGPVHGQLEASPHDVIHDDIGAGGWMSYPTRRRGIRSSICTTATSTVSGSSGLQAGAADAPTQPAMRLG